jgi:hypothetical protein
MKMQFLNFAYLSATQMLEQAIEKRFRSSRYKAKTGEKAQFILNK